ncbi:high frequency lysogenization protein HflD [Candidatus Thiosymbion oneisti]|uniref:high frequency lysogenization protein HflD n=1 Tax=Candidatus Thiosymbion oneisti TaxID=589554 RepID=UPI000B7EB0D7|nr:high frequency lysogenization protein HflD [Candidatus Thiosymbion oneisti]
MAYTGKDRSIALAGVYQSVLCVRQIARQGSVDTDAMTPCIYSLFQTDADSVPEIFGAPGSVYAGAKELVGQLTGKQPREIEPTRYVITLLKLERVLAGRSQLIRDIGVGIDDARAKLDHFPMLHPNLLAHLADIYSRTISQLQPRVMVQGDPRFLQPPDNQNRIRALLLAGVRSAWLWRQIGGSRWQFLFGRKALLMAARDYLRLARQ